MALYDDIAASVNSIIAKYKEIIGDGKLTLSEILSLAGAAAASFLELTKSLTALDEEKKKAILTAVETFYDTVLAPLDIPVVPNFLEPVVDAGLKEVVLYVTGAMIDTLMGVQAMVVGSDTGVRKYALAGPSEEHKVFLPAFLVK